MFTSAEKTMKPSTVVQRQSAGLFFARKHDLKNVSSAEKSFFSSSFIQPKLSVSQPDDPQEKEADQMAHRVMTMPEASIATARSDEKEEVQRAEEKEEVQAKGNDEKEVDRGEEREEAQRKEDELERKEDREQQHAQSVQMKMQRAASDEEEVQRKQDSTEEQEKDEAATVVQRKAAGESGEEELQRKCDQCTEEKANVSRQTEKEEISAKLFDSPSVRSGFGVHRLAEEKDTTVSRKVSSAGQRGVVMRSGRAPPGGSETSFEQNLESSRGTGSPLSGETRSFMESRFSADFSGVRVHTNETSVQMNRDIHAQAFTYGNDIYFNENKYSPNSTDGRHLLAHELTHTIQQGASHHTTTSQSGAKSISTKRLSRRKIQRSPANLNAAVSLAKGEAGKVIANKEGADGFRTGWQRLLEYFKTTLGAEKILPAGQAGDATTVPEDNIKKKKDVDGMAIVLPDGKTGVGKRDAMPSWCGIFAFWALNKAGLPMKKWLLGNMTIPREAILPPGMTPPPGYLAYRNLRSHYGLVERADATSVTSINGNTAGEDNLGGEIQVQTHAMSSWTGFFDPMKLIEGTVRSPETGVQEKPKTLRELRKELFNVSRKEDDQKKKVDAENIPVSRKTEQLPASHAPPVDTEKKEELQRLEENHDEKVQPKQFAASGPDVVQRKSGTKIQRGIFGSIAGAISSAVEWVGDKLEEGKKWLLGKISSLIMNVPGYKALRVALGEDPISGEKVERNGKNFIDAALDLMPGGRKLKQKLQELGILEKAEQFVDSTIGRVTDLINGIFDTFERFYNSLSLSDVKDVPGVFRRLENAFTSFFNQIISFAKGVADDFLEFIKQALLIPLATYIKTKTRYWDLLCLILGKDPLTDERKPMNGTNILNAFLKLSEWGEEQRKKMMETGTFQKVAAWIDKGIAIFSTSYSELKAAFLGLWDYVTIDSLMNPVSTFKKIFESFWRPIERVGRYVIDTGVMILKIVKDVLFRWISEEAKKKKGYYLITVLISKDPFTGDKVSRTTENLVKGFMLLAENGEEQFNKMKESGAIDRAVTKIDAAVKTLGFTWEYVKGLFIGLWNSFTWKDFVVPVLAFGKIIKTFANPVYRLIRFIITVVMALIEVILRMMGFPVDMVFKLIDNAKKAWNTIKANVAGFFINILKAIKQGFAQFFDNFLKHLVNGLVDWFFDQLKDVGVTRPPDLSLKSIINLVLQVLGITMEKIWKKLADKIGQEKVAKLRGALSKLEGIWKFIKDVQERGVGAIWDYIKDQLSNLWTKVLEAATNWIMDKIITQITVKLLSMLDPTGIMAVVNSVIAIYKAIESFIQYFERMLGIVNSFVEGILEIAEGNIKKAANFLENSMASAVPVVIGFLANQVGLGKIGRKIVEVIQKVQETVDKALDWLVDKAVSIGMKVIGKVKEGVKKIAGWLGMKKEFTSSAGKKHSMYFKKQGKGAKLIMESKPVPVEDFLKNRKKEIPKDAALDDAKKSALLGKVTTCEQQIAKLNDLTYPKDRDAKPADAIELDILATSETIVNLLKELDPAGGGGVVPAPQFNPGFSNAVKAQFFDAKYISDKPKPNYEHGEPAENYKGTLSGALTKLESWGVRAKWVAFHIVNENYGGKATSSNLVPTPQHINKEYLHAFENKLKQYLAAGHPIWMSFSCAYRSGMPFLQSLTAKGGAMKFDAGNWVEDPSMPAQYSVTVDEPYIEMIEINKLKKDPDLWYFYTKETGLDSKTLDFLAGEVAKGIRFTSNDHVKSHMEKYFTKNKQKINNIDKTLISYD
jgi:hypothetical protein